jgi:murein DD-endopeptidase MepM/ murein hydrolase activator NlpD
MRTTIAALTMAGAVVAGCASPAPAPTARPTEGSVAPAIAQASPTPLPTTVPTNTPNPTPTVTAIPEPTNTPTPLPTYTLSGTVFFDYNGNGLRDEGEPPIEGVPIRVAELNTTSGPDGSYSLLGIPADTHEVYVESPDTESGGFRYVTTPASAIQQTIGEPIPVLLDQDQGLNIGLGIGFLTLPFRCQDRNHIVLFSYFDLDPREGSVRNYLGSNRVADWNTDIVGTFDQHYGIDYAAEVGVPIVAAAPGRVNWIGETEETRSLAVFLDHDQYGVVTTGYSHLSQILVHVGQVVGRGEIVGLNGATGTYTTQPHLHFNLFIDNVIVDPFRDVADPDSVSYWIGGNDNPCCP